MSRQPVKAEAVVKFLLAETNATRREAVVEIQGITLVLAAQLLPYAACPTAGALALILR